MHPDVESELLAALESNVDRPAAPPAADAWQPPASAYADATVHASELERLFHARWIPVARTSELAAAGAFRTLDLGSARVALVRDAAGQVRALHNVCLHRGAQILREACGRADRLRCPYHALTYGLDGGLERVPVAESFPTSLQPGTARLAPIACEERHGFHWVRINAQGPSLDESLGGDLLDELSAWPLDGLEVRMERDVEADFDWKIGVEAFLEPLHVPAIHGRSAHPVVDFRGMAARELAPHSRMALPFRDPDAYGPDGVLGSFAAAAGVQPFEGLNAAQMRAHLVYLVFPSTVWMLFPNHVLSIVFLPVAPGRCRMQARLLTAPATDATAAAFLDSMTPGYAGLLDEDVENLPWIQRGLADPSFERCRLSGYETRIAMFWRAYADAMATPGA